MRSTINLNKIQQQKTPSIAGPQHKNTHASGVEHADTDIRTGAHQLAQTYHSYTTHIILITRERERREIVIFICLCVNIYSENGFPVKSQTRIPTVRWHVTVAYIVENQTQNKY